MPTRKTIIWVSEDVWKWKTIKIEVQEKDRYEFYGRGCDLYEVVRIASKHPPNGYVDVDALEYIRNYLDYSADGVWVWYDIDS